MCDPGHGWQGGGVTLSRQLFRGTLSSGRGSMRLYSISCRRPSGSKPWGRARGSLKDSGVGGSSRPAGKRCCPGLRLKQTPWAGPHPPPPPRGQRPPVGSLARRCRGRTRVATAVSRAGRSSWRSPQTGWIATLLREEHLRRLSNDEAEHRHPRRTEFLKVNSALGARPLLQTPDELEVPRAKEQHKQFHGLGKPNSVLADPSGTLGERGARCGVQGKRVGQWATGHSAPLPRSLPLKNPFEAQCGGKGAARTVRRGLASAGGRPTSTGLASRGGLLGGPRRAALDGSALTTQCWRAQAVAWGTGADFDSNLSNIITGDNL